MQFPLRTKTVLMCLLIALNLILRYPTSPHEIGMDSFAVHGMANSISEFGYAKWWIHPASIIGWYPYSSVSAVSFVLSGMSQCTSMDTEKVILLYGMILGIFSIFGAYLMAGVVWNNDIFKFVVAAVFSASQGIITFSTWTAHSRTLFVISLPLFIYLLLKTRTFTVRFGILTSVILAMLLVTHHYIYFVMPIIISYLIIVVVYKAGKHIKSIRIPENIANLAVFVGFLIMFLIPFFTRTLAESDPGGMAGGRYAWMSTMIQSYTRYMGILIILVVSGYVYLLLKQNKKLEEWYLLLCLIGLAQFLYIITYMKWFVLPFASLLIGISLTNVANVKTDTQKRKIVPSLIVVIILLLSLCFTGYYQYLHFLNDPNPNKRYMEDRTYTGGLWIKDNVDKNKRMIASLRVFSISGVPTLTGSGTTDLTYGFVDPNKLEVKQIYPATSVAFYFHDPYKVVNHTYTEWYAYNIVGSDINDRTSWAYRLIPKYNLSYYAENMDSGDKLSHSVQQTKDCLYDNGKIRLWNLIGKGQ
jgi:hypothetical protein